MSPTYNVRTLRVLAFDSIAVRGEPVKLRALVERRWFGLLRQPLQGRKVEFEQTGRMLGCVESCAGGFAELACDAARGAFTARGGAASSVGRVFVWDRDDPLLIVDLDGTISDATALAFWLLPLDAVQPFDGAVRAMAYLSTRYRILYLTARRDLVLPKSRLWLQHHGFPPGPILCRPWNLFPPSPGRFKTAALAELKRRFSNIRAGIGDRPHDARALLSNGIPTLLYRPARAPEGAVAFSEWEDILRHLNPQ
jgi:hypothetical protein